MARRTTIPVIAVLLVLLAGAIALSGSPRFASAAQGDGGFINHPSIVPSEPALGYPRTLTTPLNLGKPRQSHAVDLIGRYLVSGGDFLNVEMQNGSVVPQEYLAIYDSVSKGLVPTARGRQRGVGDCSGPLPGFDLYRRPFQRGHRRCRCGAFEPEGRFAPPRHLRS